MAKFLFIYRSKTDTNVEEFSPEMMQQVMQEWNEWIGKGFQAGWLLDAGDALKAEGKVVNSARRITDGPFAEAKEIVGGYSIVQAKDVQAACDLAKTCPALSGDGSVEIRELAGLAPPKE